MCRSAGYFEHALAVAQAAGEPEWRLEILLEDCRQYDEALDFLRGLLRQQAAASLHRHGKARALGPVWSVWARPRCLTGWHGLVYRQTEPRTRLLTALL